MEIKIHAGQRVLYKHNGQWCVGKLTNQMSPELTEKGLFVFVIPKDYMDAEEVSYLHDVEINDLFLEAIPVEDWMAQYGYLMPKEDYINFIKSEEFDKNTERAYVSDGEYYYYNVNKYSEQWLNKQPFDYIVREE
jgi:hypothetical protein